MTYLISKQFACEIGHIRTSDKYLGQILFAPSPPSQQKTVFVSCNYVLLQSVLV